MSKHALIEFSVQGYIRQDIRLLDPDNYPADKIVEMLNDGTAVTSIHEDGGVEIVHDREVIAEIEGNSREDVELVDYDLVGMYSLEDDENAGS